MLDNWRNTFILTIPLRIILTFQTSYLHPDEQFQSFEPLAKAFLGYKTNIPWEFDSVPSRSILPLLLEYPVVYLNKWLNLPALTVYYLARLQFCLVSWVITDWCLYQIMPTKQERLKLIFFNSISYITLTYQSHTFTNSMETCFVLLALVIVEDFRDTMEVQDRLTESNKKELRAKHLKQSIYLGIIIALGTLNRITFMLWLVLPMYFVLKFGFKISFKSLVLTGTSAVFTLIMGFAVDIWWFNKRLVVKMFIPYFKQFWLTKDLKFLKLIFFKLCTSTMASPSIIPLINNITYNVNSENLALHGIHGRYTHLLINLPLMFGPMLLLIVYPKNYLKTIPFLSFISGVLILSVFPHQEMRFLLPLVPLASCFIDLWLWSKVERIEEPKVEEKEEKEEPETKDEQKKDTDEDTDEEEKVIPQENPAFIRTDSKIIPIILRGCILFNIVMCLIMGVFHQGGVIPAIETLQKRNEKSKSISIWWRSYSPPLWMFSDKSLSYFLELDPDLRLSGFLNYITDDIPRTVNSVIDVLGLDADMLKFALSGMLLNSAIPATTDVLIVAPIASFNTHLIIDSRFNFTQLFNYNYHLDFDHFDEFDQFGMASLEPGFGIWNVKSTILIEDKWQD